MQNKGQQKASSRQRPDRGKGRNQRPQAPPEFQVEKIEKLEPAKLVAVLKDPGETVFHKSVACKRLAVVGTKDAVPALAALLSHPQLGQYARFGLEPLPDPSADDALRDALKKLKGRPLVGVIGSIGVRRDSKAVEPLTGLMYDSDIEVARAAATALGHISGSPAAKALQDGLSRTKGEVRATVAAAGLLCAEGFMAKGERKEALVLYDVLSRMDIPKPVRLAAMHSTIVAETSVARPR
jgi:HEAT repeat protein